MRNVNGIRKWKYKMKTKNITLSEQFQNLIKQIVERGKIDSPSE